MSESIMQEYEIQQWKEGNRTISHASYQFFVDLEGTDCGFPSIDSNVRRSALGLSVIGIRAISDQPGTFEVDFLARLVLALENHDGLQTRVVEIPFSRALYIKHPVSALKSAVIQAGRLDRLTVTPQVSSAPLALSWSVFGLAAGDQLGLNTVVTTDLNHDGVADVLAGSPSRTTAGVFHGGAVFVLSGKDGSVIYQVNGIDDQGELGFSVANIGDVTGDGISDFVAGAPTTSLPGLFHTGKVTAYSGATGAALYTLSGTEVNEQLGWSVAGIGDVNGDGIPDFVVGAPSTSPGGQLDAGSVLVVSGFDGSVLYRVDGTIAGEAFGFSVAGAGDLNGDTIPDILVGAIGSGTLTVPNAGAVYALSGSDGSILWTFFGNASGDGTGWSVTSVGDINNDGIPDVAVGAPSTSPSGLSGAGTVYLISGANGNLIRRLDGAVAHASLGTAVSGLPDMDGDNIPEIVAGAADQPMPGGEVWVGRTVIYSGATGQILQTLSGNPSYSQFGWSLKGRSASAKLVVGAPMSSGSGAANAGQVSYFVPSTTTASLAAVVTARLGLVFAE